MLLKDSVQRTDFPVSNLLSSFRFSNMFMLLCNINIAFHMFKADNNTTRMGTKYSLNASIGKCYIEAQCMVFCVPKNFQFKPTLLVKLVI